MLFVSFLVVGAAASSAWFVGVGGDAQGSQRVSSLGPKKLPAVVYDVSLGDRIYTGNWQIVTPDAKEIVCASSVFESADLHRVDAATGALLSRTHMGQSFQWLTAVNDSSRIIIACMDNFICSLEPATVAEQGFVRRWCVDVGYAGGALVAGNFTFQWPWLDNYYSYVLDTNTGSVIAQFPGGTAGAALSSDGSLFFNGISGVLQAVNRAGTRVWLQANTSWPVVDSLHGEAVYARRTLPGQKIAVVRLDPSSGNLQWSAVLDADGFSLSLVVGWKSLFVSTRGGRDLVALDPSSGRVVWNMTMPNNRTIAVAVADGQDTLFCSTNIVGSNGIATIVAVDGTAGSMLWELPLNQINDVQAMMLDQNGNLIVQRSNSVMKLAA